MPCDIRLLIAVGLSLFLAGAPAADNYTIQIKDQRQGDTYQTDKTEGSTTLSKIVDAAGKTLVESEEQSTKTTVYRETILERAAGKLHATRLKRQYEKAQVKTGNKTEELPYQGKTVLIEKKDKKYHFQIEGDAELAGKDARLLDEEFNKNDEDEFDLRTALLPKKAVALKDEWAVEMKPLLKSFSRATKMDLDADHATGTGKLVKAYQKEGVPFGVLEIHLEMPIKEIGTGKGTIKLQPGAKWTMDITLDSCIDASRLDADMKVKFQIDAAGPVPLPDGSEAKLTIKGQGTVDTTNREISKR
jgi:hypothetical protein